MAEGGKALGLRSRTLPLRVLSDAWPPTLPTCERVSLDSCGNSGQPSQAWLATLVAIDEIAHCRDENTLLRRSVELLRSNVGLERAALFLLDEAEQRLFGTWGTSANGETTDERHIAFDLGTSHRQAFAEARLGGAYWSRFRDVPLFAQTDAGTIVVGTGENVIIPIPGATRQLGLLACDWALSAAAATTDALLRATVFTRVLAPHLEKFGSPASGTNCLPPPRLTREQTQLTARTAQHLYADPNLGRGELAKRLGTTPGKLGRCFKAVFGESIRDYRNRLRLERYLALVDPQGGNLLQAALDAGFGSYAQFHRVFRQRFTCSPIEYLRERTEDGAPC